MARMLAFTHFYSILNLRLFLSTLFYNLKQFSIKTSDRNGEWYLHLLTLFAIFYESNTERSAYVYMFYVCVLYCIQLMSAVI